MQRRAVRRGALCLPLCRQRPSFLTLIEPDRLSQRRVFVPANKRICLQTHTRTTAGKGRCGGDVRYCCVRLLCLLVSRQTLFILSRCVFFFFSFVRLGQTAAHDGMTGQQHRRSATWMLRAGTTPPLDETATTSPQRAGRQSRQTDGCD